jgi:chaperonin GroES
MNLQPLFDKVVVQQAEADERIAGTSLYVAETSKEKPKRGTVIAVGEGLLLQNGQTKDIPLKVGDDVIYSPYGGNEVDINGKKYLIMAATEVLAKVVL